MMDLEESLRALYYMPVPLLVLNNNRTIKMLNRSAESYFKITSGRCIGQRLEQFLHPTSHSHYISSINESLKTAMESTPGLTRPVATRLRLKQSEKATDHEWAEFTISTWFPTDPAVGSANTPSSTSSYEVASQPSSNTSLTAASRISHESLYSISIAPCPKVDNLQATKIAESKTPSSILSLKEAVFDHMDLAVLALSKDGKTEIRNKACVDLFTSFQRPEADQMDVDMFQEEDILPWAKSSLTFYDEHFDQPFSDGEWPIYYAAILGIASPTVAVGSECKATGVRKILEITPKAIRDRGSYGEHIGGLCSFRDISAERKMLQQEAEHQSEVQLRNTLNKLPHLNWQSTPEGFVDFYSLSFLEYAGLPYSQMEGSGWVSTMKEEDFPHAAGMWSESLRTGNALDVAFRLRRHDGVYRWFLCRTVPRRDVTGKIVRWIGCNTDVNDQVEALAKSQRTQAQMQSVINHAAVTLWAVDKEGIVTVAEGPGIRQFKNVSHSRGINDDMLKEGIVGRSLYEVWGATDVQYSATVRELISKALNGENVINESELEGRWYRTSYTPLREQNKDLQILPNGTFNHDVEWNTEEGDIVGVVGVSIDVTERKQAQERIEESALEKTRALAAEEAAREASRLKSQFLANMSHEIRTPISGIIGLSELLLDEEGLTSKHREYAETIERSAEGLLTVINDVLDFSKVEIGKLDVEQVPFNLVVLLGDLKRMLSFATHKKGLDFKESINLTHKTNIIGDLGRLRQVLTNLLTNAIKFTSQGYISLEVVEQQIDANEISIRFDIKDSGCGIKSEALSQLFQPFSQGDASTARRFGGTGLGLSISKNLVELMGGVIGLTSTEGQGTHAWFTIPFRRASVTEQSGQKRKAEVLVAEQFGIGSGGMPIVNPETLNRPKKDIWILVAEDNAVNASIACKNIEKMGYSCQVAENGLIALQALDKKRFDAILMDCQMPDCDGYEATRQIRKSSNVEIRTLPIIALTASAIKGDRERALEAGMVDYLAKPIKRNVLEGTLSKWLYDYSARQDLAAFI